MTLSDRDWIAAHVALTRNALPAPFVPLLGRLVADTMAIAAYARRHRVGGAGLDEAGLNGTAAEALDFQEVLINGRNNGHAAVVIVPAVLALAEMRGASPEAVLKALWVGFAANIALGETLGRAHRAKGLGFRTTSLTAAPAAALACAVLVGADIDAALAATGICAGTLPAGLLSAMSPKVGSYSPDKDFSVGFSARHALHCALLAEAGATGPDAPITGDKGWLASFGAGSADPAFLATPPGERDLAAYSIKLFPANFGCQAAIRGAMELGREIGAERIDRLVLKVKSSSAGSLSTRKIDNHLAARFSLPFAAASACVRGRSVLADFEGEAVHDPAVLAFMDRVTIEGDEALEARHLALGIFPARIAAWSGARLLGEKAYDGPFDGVDAAGAEALFARKLESLVDAEAARRLLAYARAPLESLPPAP
jgi:2-methylcitrate dehydratase PrpD